MKLCIHIFIEKRTNFERFLHLKSLFKIYKPSFEMFRIYIYIYQNLPFPKLSVFMKTVS